jgi:hypothetical protein
MAALLLLLLLCKAEQQLALSNKQGISRADHNREICLR